MNQIAMSGPCNARLRDEDDLSACCGSSHEAIELDDVSVSYGDEAVVTDVALRIPRNAVTALIGPSGCGKSSLLYCLNRMCDLIPGCRTRGSVRFGWLDNERLACDPTILRRHVGMLFQRPGPFPFSIRRNIEFALRQHGVRARPDLDERVEWSLREAGLWDEVRDRLDRPALGLSGGQQQRLCLARALALDPSVLLMDEPCSALDPISTRKLEDLIRRLASDRTIVLVTHSLPQARRVADHVALLWKAEGDAGRLVEHGHARRFFEQPRHAVTREYLSFA